MTPVLQNPQIPGITHPHPSPIVLHPPLSSRSFIHIHNPFHPPLHPQIFIPQTSPVSWTPQQSPGPADTHHSQPSASAPPPSRAPGPPSPLAATRREPTQISGFSYSHRRPPFSPNSFIPTHSLSTLPSIRDLFPSQHSHRHPNSLLDPTATSGPANAHHSQPSPTAPILFQLPQTSTPARRTPLSPF